MKNAFNTGVLRAGDNGMSTGTYHFHKGGEGGVGFWTKISLPTNKPFEMKCIRNKKLFVVVFLSLNLTLLQHMNIVSGDVKKIPDIHCWF